MAEKKMLEMQLEWTLEAQHMEGTFFSSNWKYHAYITEKMQFLLFEDN